MRTGWIGIVAGVLALSPTAGVAQTSADAFAGKTVRIVIGFANAGTYGQYAQLAAQHLRKHLPGNPSVIVQEMQGAGGLVALNHMANVAAKDGMVAMLPPISVVQDGLLDSAARFDPAGFVWIGRMMELVQLGVASERSGVASLADARTRPVSSGGTGPTNPTAMTFHILNVLTGTKFNVVSGYKGLPDAQLAWERGEVDTVMLNWETIAERYMEPIKAGTVRPLFAYAGRPLPEIAGRPLLKDFGRSEVEKAFLAIYSVGSEIGRSVALPAGVPAERVATWRVAFNRMLADPEFAADAAQRKLRFDPASGATMEAIVKRSMAMSAETLAGVKAFYGQLLGVAR